jgi:putative phosphoribosyl transferase
MLGVDGDLVVPAEASAIVVFAHGSGSSRRSPRNRQVASALNDAGFATLLFDLLTDDEALDRANVFDIALLGSRLSAAALWLRSQPKAADLPLGYFGASTGAAAALWAATEPDGGRVGAIVSRGGRPDLAADRLPLVQAPTLLIVGGDDQDVLALNRQARARLRCQSDLIVIPGAGHLFEEPGALEQVAVHAATWFARYLRPDA